MAKIINFFLEMCVLCFHSSYNILQKFFLAHYNALYVYLEPIEGSPNTVLQVQNPKNSKKEEKPSRWDWKFLYPILVLVGGNLYGNVLLVYLSHDSKKGKSILLDEGETNQTQSQFFSLKSVLTSEKAMFHQVISQDVWPQSDISICISTVSSIAAYAVFLRRPCPVPRYQLCPQATKYKNSSKENQTQLTIAGQSKID